MTQADSPSCPTTMYSSSPLVSSRMAVRTAPCEEMRDSLPWPPLAPFTTILRTEKVGVSQHRKYSVLVIDPDCVSTLDVILQNQSLQLLLGGIRLPTTEVPISGPKIILKFSMQCLLILICILYEWVVGEQRMNEPFYFIRKVK